MIDSRSGKLQYQAKEGTDIFPSEVLLGDEGPFL